MEKQQLQLTLAELHQALENVDQLDTETRELMETLTDDLDRLLGEGGPLSADHVQPVAHNLQTLLLKFEAEHPQLTGILNRIASGLANVGI